MRFFIDTADVQAVRDLLPLGIVDGITTNPSLIAASGEDIFNVIASMCELTAGPVSAEVVAQDAEGMIAEGEKLAAINNNVAVKLPLTIEGLKASHILSQKEIMTNVTLCFSANQALLAAKAGATFISPFIGRLDDIGHDGMQLISEIREVYDQHPELPTQILAASARTPMHVLQAAKIGADVITLPPKLIYQMVKHPLTDKGLEIFMEDWKKTGQSIL